jgi:hypothetical protein
MSHRLPEKGLWHVADRRGAGEMPFDLIKLDLRGRGAGRGVGSVRARNLETRLRRVRITGPDRFVAAYDMRRHSGEVAGIHRPDGSLKLTLTGTVSATFVACAAETGMAGDLQTAGWGPADWRAEAPDALRALAGCVDALCRRTGMTAAA